MGQGQGPETEVGGRVRYHTKHELDRLDGLKIIYEVICEGGAGGSGKYRIRQASSVGGAPLPLLPLPLPPGASLSLASG